MSLCADCGDDATTTAPVYTGPNTYIDEALCTVCAQIRDNREPSEPDGEDLLRDYRAEERDRMDDARRVK